jgi:hypothetical protein
MELIISWYLTQNFKLVNNNKLVTLLIISSQMSCEELSLCSYPGRERQFLSTRQCQHYFFRDIRDNNMLLIRIWHFLTLSLSFVGNLHYLRYMLTMISISSFYFSIFQNIDRIFFFFILISLIPDLEMENYIPVSLLVLVSTDDTALLSVIPVLIR